MATVTFSAADDLLYAYLAGEIDHDAAQNLRIQLTMPFWPAPQNTGARSGRGWVYGFVRGGADSGPPALRPQSGRNPAYPARPGAAAPRSAAGQYPARMQDRRNEDESGKHDQDQFDSLSVNEAYARGAAAAFLARYDPTVPQLADLKTAVSEAVTNCIVHAYPDRVGPITMTVSVYPGRVVRIVIADKGVGIPDIPRAMEPLFTTGNPEERSGLGFAVMQSFMDKVSVRSAPGRGTRVILTKHLEEKPST